MNHLGTKVIETPRLRLRPFTLEDAPAMYKNWACDPEVTRYLTWPAHGDVRETLEILSSWVPRYGERDCYLWCIELKSLGEPVGSISVVHLDEDISCVELGYCIGRAFWRQGITSEALAALLPFFFEEVGVNRVEARHDLNNPNSGRVMRKCGLLHWGTRIQGGLNNVGVCDLECYGVTRDQWRG